MLEEDGTPHDFSLVTTDQIINELFRRNDAAVVVRHQDLGADDKLLIDTHGGLTMCMGLVERAKLILAEDHANSDHGERDAEDDD